LEGVKVLVVEDFADSREMVTTILENAGAVVKPAADTAQALAALDRSAPDLILADIGLPGEDGFDLMRKVRARPGPEARVPAIALTAWGMARDRAQAKEVGYQAHLIKPIDPSTLISVLEALVTKA
jgi:CheY-like chemotaxis protein